VRSERGRVVEVETLEEFDRRVAAGATAMEGWHLQSLDLRDRGEALRALPAAGALFLGCTFTEGDEQSLRASGALVFPRVPDVPFDAYRASLYGPRELYDGLATSYDATRTPGSTPGRAAAHPRRDAGRRCTTAIDNALRDLVAGRDLVGDGRARPPRVGGYADAARLGSARSGQACW
jgi:hypothetical protein